MFRVFIGQIGFSCFYIAATLIPMFMLTIVSQTAPLWTSLLGLWVNKEKVLCFEYVSMALCFIGVLSLTFSKHQTAQEAEGEGTTMKYLLGCLAAFTFSWAVSVVSICNRRLKEVDTPIILFWHLIFGLAMGLLSYLYQYLAEGFVI